MIDRSIGCVQEMVKEEVRAGQSPALPSQAKAGPGMSSVVYGSDEVQVCVLLPLGL